MNLYYLIHPLLDITLVNQSNPSYNPSPVSAQHPYMYHSLALILWSPNFSVISGTPITPISYLLAKTRTAASFNSSSYNIDVNSYLAKSIPKIIYLKNFIYQLNQPHKLILMYY